MASFIGLASLVIGLVIVSIIVGAILPTGLGRLANSSNDSRMVNTDSTSKSLFNQLPLFIIIAIIIGVFASILASTKSNQRGNRE